MADTVSFGQMHILLEKWPVILEILCWNKILLILEGARRLSLILPSSIEVFNERDSFLGAGGQSFSPQMKPSGCPESSCIIYAFLFLNCMA